MGKRGPKKTPTVKLKARGSRRAETRKREPAPPLRLVGQPEPDWITDFHDPSMEGIRRHLHGMGVLTEIDRLAMRLLMDAVTDYEEAKKLVYEHGSIATSATSGAVYQHPAVGLRNQAWDRVLKISREFGLTPSSRADITLPAATKSTGNERFFNQGAG